MSRLLVEVYSRKDCEECSCAKGDDCTLCGDVSAVIDRVSSEIPFQVRVIDISSSEDLLRRYRDDIPTVFLNGKKAFKFKVDEAEFRKKARIELIKAGLMRLKTKKEKTF